MAKQVSGSSPTSIQVIQLPQIAAYSGQHLRALYADGLFEPNANDEELIGLAFFIIPQFPARLGFKKIYYSPPNEDDPLPHFVPDINLETFPQSAAYYLTNNISPISQAIPSELEFYSTVDLIFFTVGQLRPLLDMASPDNEVVICGCEIDFGLAAYDKPDFEDNRVGKHFSLKMEVNVPPLVDPSADPENETEETSQMPIPLIVTGQPCPPYWYPFPDSLTQILSSASTAEAGSVMSNIHHLYESWIDAMDKLARS